MVDEDAIRDALLGAQEKLAIAYQQGPAALELFHADFEILKSRIISAAQAGLLSRDTLQIAANVVRGIPIIVQSFIRLEQQAAEGLGKLHTNTREQVLLCLDDPRRASSSRAGGFHDPSQEESDETDADSEDDLDPESYAEFSDDDDEELHEPRWTILRDWFLNNLGHPFAVAESEHEDLLKTANISYPSFVHWLEQMRRHIRWDRLLSVHGKGSPRELASLVSVVLHDNHNTPIAKVEPETCAALLEAKRVVTESCDEMPSKWWEESIQLVELMKEFHLLGAEEVVQWESAEEVVSEDGSEQSEDEIDTAVSSIGTRFSSEATLVYEPPPTSGGRKRKAAEMTLQEISLVPQSSRLHSHVDEELRSSKRRKRDVPQSVLSIPRRSSSVVSDATTINSGSSGASPAPSSFFSSTVPSTPSNKAFSRRPSPAIVPPTNLSQVADSLVIPSIPSFASLFVSNIDTVVHPVTKAVQHSQDIPQAQIEHIIKLEPTEFRSIHSHFSRKRKRQVDTTPPVQGPLPVGRLFKPILANSTTSKQNNKPHRRSLYLSPLLPSIITSTSIDQPPPRKRMRLNHSTFTTIHPAPAIKLDPCREEESLTHINEHPVQSSTSNIGATGPSAAAPFELVATLSCGTPHTPKVLDQDFLGVLNGHPSSDMSTPSNYQPSHDKQGANLDDLLAQLLANADTPYLTAPSPAADTPSSWGDVATPGTVVDFAHSEKSFSMSREQGYPSFLASPKSSLTDGRYQSYQLSEASEYSFLR